MALSVSNLHNLKPEVLHLLPFPPAPLARDGSPVVDGPGHIVRAQDK